LAATIVEEEEELAATFVEEVLELVAPFLPINRQQESRANREMRVVRNVENKRESGELQWQQLQVQQKSWELSLSEVILLLHVCCNPFSIYL
jgi:hypothetical protein